MIFFLRISYKILSNIMPEKLFVTNNVKTPKELIKKLIKILL